MYEFLAIQFWKDSYIEYLSALLLSKSNHHFVLLLFVCFTALHPVKSSLCFVAFCLFYCFTSSQQLMSSGHIVHYLPKEDWK